MDDIRGRYQLIGGRSPLLDLTRAQGSALEARLNANATRFWVYVACGTGIHLSRHREADGDNGIHRVVAVSMAPVLETRVGRIDAPWKWRGQS